METSSIGTGAGIAGGISGKKSRWRMVEKIDRVLEFLKNIFLSFALARYLSNTP